MKKRVLSVITGIALVLAVAPWAAADEDICLPAGQHDGRPVVVCAVIGP